MRNKSFNLTNTTEKEYKDWCKKNKKDCLKESSKGEFFKLVLDGVLVRDKEGKLVEVNTNEKK